MAKTLLQGLAQVRYYLDTTAENGGTWDNTLLTVLLNEGQRHVMATVDDRMLDSNCQSVTNVTSVTATGGDGSPRYFAKSSDNLRTVTVTVGAGMTPAYPLPSLNALMEQNSKAYGTEAVLGLAVPVSSYFYNEFGGKVYLNSRVTATGGAPIKEFYVKDPPALSTVQNFIVPDSLFDWVCIYATITALVGVGKMDTAGAFMGIVGKRAAEFESKWGVCPPVPFVEIPKQK